MFFSRLPFLRGALAFCAIGALASVSLAQRTDLIREFVKQKSKVEMTIVVSGRSAEYYGKRLRERMISHKERNDKALPDSAIKLIMLDSYNTAVSSGNTIKGNVVILCAIDDTDWQVPSSIKDLIGVRARNLGEQDSFVEVVRTQDPSKGLAHRMVVLAPDEARLERTASIALEREVGKWNDLEIPGLRFESHRAAVYGPANLIDTIGGWGGRSGASVWNDVAKIPLEAQSTSAEPDFWREREIILLHDRSKNAPIPDFAVSTIQSANYRITEMRISRHKTEDGRSMAVYSAPTLAHLRHLMAEGGIHSQLSTDRSIDLKDLRGIGRGPMVVAVTSSSALSPNALEDTRAGLELFLRNELSLTINPRGRALQAIEKELTLQSLQGKTNTITELLKDGVKYLWLFEVETPTGSSSFRPTEVCEIRDPGPFSEAEPSRPGSKAKQSEWDYYRERLRDWQERKEQNHRIRYVETAGWVRSINQSSSATVRGTLHVIDLSKGAGEVLVSLPGVSTVSDSKEFKRDQTTTRGAANRPDSLPAPASSSTPVPELVVLATKDAGLNAVKSIRNQVLMLEDGVPAPPPIAVIAQQPAGGPAKPPASPPKAAQAKVQRTSNGRIIVIDVPSTWEVGNVLSVEVAGTSQRLMIKLQSFESGYVICIPANAKDKAQVAKVKVGSTVKFEKKS